MVNPYRGEVALTVDGTRHLLRLPLGALASLEARLESGSLVALIERFEDGSFRTRDLIALLAAGLAGGGADMTEADLAAAEIDGGPVAAARAAAALLKLTFALPETLS